MFSIAKKMDLTGNKYGRLTVVSFAYRADGKRKEPFWNCLCDCGEECVANGTSIRRGLKKSCGCINRDNHPAITHGLSGDRIYTVHNSLKERCLNKNHDAYHRYGGRGIGVCDEWLDFETFNKWANENGYKDNLTIERVDVNKGYSPDNCIWIPMGEQKFNRRIPSNNKTGYPGIRYCNQRRRFIATLNLKSSGGKYIRIGSFHKFISAFIARREKEYEVYKGRYLYHHPDLKEIRDKLYSHKLNKFSEDTKIPEGIEYITNKKELWGYGRDNNV